MNRKPRVDRSPEEKSQMVREGIKSGNVCGVESFQKGAIQHFRCIFRI
jgi:hypothetical protein